MAGQGGIIDDPEVRARWEGFQWTPENARLAKDIVGRYPEGRQMSASIPWSWSSTIAWRMSSGRRSAS